MGLLELWACPKEGVWMSERYWITGVQLGMLKIGTKDMRGRLADEIIDKQFINNFYTDEEKKEFIKSIKRR